MSAVKAPLRVMISGAAGQIGYSLIPLIASGSVFGADQPIILHLLDLEFAQKTLQGVVMEIDDCAYPLVQSVVATSDLQVACTGVNYAVLVGGFPRKAGMQRKDLMDKNVPIFVGQGRALNAYADKNVKVLVVANPANTNSLILALNAPDIPKTNFSCLTRLDDNRAKAQLAQKAGVQVAQVKNTIIWGNHSKTQFPDISHAIVSKDSQEHPAAALVNDDEWNRTKFIPTVQNRGAAVIEMRGLSSAMSAANASADHLRDWHNGTKPGEYVSMGIFTTGQYGVEPGLMFSFPCICKDGQYQVVEGLAWDELSQTMIKATEKELIEEKAEALHIIESLAASQ